MGYSQQSISPAGILSLAQHPPPQLFACALFENAKKSLYHFTLGQSLLLSVLEFLDTVSNSMDTTHVASGALKQASNQCHSF